MTALLLIAALDLGVLFSDKSAWTEKAEIFAVDHKAEGFEFASEARDQVNCLDPRTCVWHGLKVWETRVFFDKSGDEDVVSRVELSLYNRGDADSKFRQIDKHGQIVEIDRGAKIDIAGLKAKIAAVDKVMAGGKAPKPDRTTLKNGSLRYSRTYAKSDPQGELVWGLSALDADNKRGVEYLRLTLTPAKAASQRRDGRSAAKKPVGKGQGAKIKDNVTKSPNGDVFIDNVPMVDQGQKGYCAAAVAERVLRYYGAQIDEHEIAQQAGTMAEGGTRTRDMKKAVTVIGEKNGLGFQEIVAMQSDIGDLEEQIARYNKAAKAAKRPSISIEQFTRGNQIYVGEIFDAMEPKVIYKMRQKDPRLKKFSAGVRQQVNAGIPVFWGVTLGIFPERGVNPQSSGGHMRLIIGYNDKKKEILYTDTWGEGHELKRMPEDWAFTITHDAFFLKPR